MRLLLLALVLLVPQVAQADTLIPPVVLQGCAPKVKPSRAVVTQYGGAAVGGSVVGFDISFLNTSDKLATLVLLRIGDTDFAKTGTFAPNAVVGWRLAALPGPCQIVAVKFKDGTEWDAPAPTPSPSPRGAN